MDITGVIGLIEAEVATLKALGAIKVSSLRENNAICFVKNGR